MVTNPVRVFRHPKRHYLIISIDTNYRECYPWKTGEPAYEELMDAIQKNEIS